jgi:FMN reductase
VREADAVIAVSPIFEASYSGLFKMFFDVLREGTLAGKPVLVAPPPARPGTRSALEFADAPLFAYLRADVMPDGGFAASEDFGSSRLSLSARVDRAGAGAGGQPSPHAPVRPGRPVRRSDAVRAADGGCLLGPLRPTPPPAGHLQRCNQHEPPEEDEHHDRPELRRGRLRP